MQQYYTGIMEARRGQIVTTRMGAHGLVAATFPDGAVIGCNPKAFHPVEEMREAA